MTLKEAADRLGMDPATLRQQIHARRLRARKLGPIWTIEEADLAAYRLDHRGRVGRPFVGRPGYVDTGFVRVRLYLSPADGRGHDAIWLQYLRESVVCDLDWSDPRPFRPSREVYEHLDLLTDRPPAGRSFELWNRDQLAHELDTTGPIIDLLGTMDPTFPAPVVTFRDGPVWDAAIIERWQAAKGPVERWSLPTP